MTMNTSYHFVIVLLGLHEDPAGCGVSLFLCYSTIMHLPLPHKSKSNQEVNKCPAVAWECPQKCVPPYRKAQFHCILPATIGGGGNRLHIKHIAGRRHARRLITLQCQLVVPIHTAPSFISRRFFEKGTLCHSWDK